MTTKFTPGPWLIRHGGSGFIGTEYQTVAVAYGDDPDCHPDSRMLANARLIAAAPDLLEALESCVIWNGKRGPDDNLLPIDRQPGEIAKAMRAIAKARGET